jgi:biopolymer transport protein ExbD
VKQKALQHGEHEDISEINITPMIDLCLVLVIMLMIISPMAMQSMIKVTASRGAVAALTDAPSNDKPLYVEVRGGDFYMNSRKMRHGKDLYLHLKGELSRKGDKTILVTGDEKAKHGTMVYVLDLAKQAGAKKLSLVKKARGGQ